MFQELLEKLKEAEESHGTLQAECEQYRTVLAETVSDGNHSRVVNYGVSLHIYIGFLFLLGRNAETSAKERGGGRAGMESQDGYLRGTVEGGKLYLKSKELL